MPFNIDLHTHSFFSGDGISSPEDLIAAARAKGLNGIAITDHNTCDAVNYLLQKGLMRLDGLPVNDFLVLPGVEVTTADGHLLCIGAELPYLKGKPAREVCDIIHERGGLAIPPHPYDLYRAVICFSTLDTLDVYAIDIVDPAGYEEYKNLAGATVEKYGAKYVVRGGRTEVLEGDWKPKRIVVLQFDSAQHAKDWLNCEEYREPRQMRHRTARTNMILVEGLAGP